VPVSTPQLANTRNWPPHFLAVVFTVALSVGVFFPTWASLVEIWRHSETYTHGFIIAPISLWLVCTQKNHWFRLTPNVSYLGLLPVIVGGFFWLAASLSHVLAAEQFATIIMLLGGVWVVLGNTVTHALVFPLCFLLFMVPVGEDLIPPLIEFTATFTVALLRLTGLPVYREGNFFTLTSGSWSVVEACSGINYLIASITLGFVYAYLNYSSYWKRGVFLLISVIVPIIANGFRAYLIVMIGHLSNMTLAVGVDHLIYGGIFFGLVILLLFYLGSFWRDPPYTPIVGFQTKQAPRHKQQVLYPAIASLSICFMAWPVSLEWLSTLQPENRIPAEFMPQNFQNWHKIENLQQPNGSWQPHFDTAVDQRTEFYRNEQETVGIHIAGFGKEQQGRELVNSQNTLINPRQANEWRVIDHSIVAATLPQHLKKSVISGNDRQIIAYEWYQIGNKTSINPYQAKLMQLLKRVAADERPELKIVVWQEVPDKNLAKTASKLREFTKTWLNQTRFF